MALASDDPPDWGEADDEPHAALPHSESAHEQSAPPDKLYVKRVEMLNTQEEEESYDTEQEADAPMRNYERQLSQVRDLWPHKAWPLHACCRAAARVTRSWLSTAARRLLLRLNGRRHLPGFRLVEGVVRLEAPWSPPDGRRVEVMNLALTGLLSAAQEAMLAWPQARAEWWHATPPALVLPGGTVEWAVWPLQVTFPGLGALRRRVQVTLRTATIV